MPRRVPQETKDKILADWRTGAYTQEDLVDKYKVSDGLVCKLCRGVQKDMSEIVRKEIESKQALANASLTNPHIIEAVEKIVRDATSHLIFFTSASLIVAHAAVSKVMNPDGKLTMYDLKAAQEVIAKGKETVFGKQPETAVQVNVNTEEKQSKEEYLQAREEALKKY